MEVKILSTETIKPSPFSIPPHRHLKTFPISLLDKLSPQVYTPIIFFYSINDNNDGVDVDGRRFIDEGAVAAALKLSLSETLGRFYVLAGKVKDDIIHFSDDDGALFLEVYQFYPTLDILLAFFFVDRSLYLYLKMSIKYH